MEEALRGEQRNKMREAVKKIEQVQAKKIAVNMLKLGKGVIETAENSGLSVEEIIKLKQKLKIGKNPIPPDEQEQK